MLDRLNQLYIEARYPGEQGLLPEGKPTMEEAQKFFRFAGRMLAMITSDASEKDATSEK